MTRSSRGFHLLLSTHLHPSTHRNAVRALRIQVIAMTCLEVADFLLDYVEGALPEVVRAAFEEHLRACPTCVTYVENYRVTIRLGNQSSLANEREPALPEELVRAILDSIRATG
jgi:anti-sigma factor RsiW